MISLDFSAQTSWPRARPYSPAQAVTTCSGPRSSFASWLRRADLPSMAMIGRSTPVSADGLVAEAGDPGVEAGLEGLGLEQHQDAAEDVLAGDAAGQVEEAHQEVLLEAGPAGDGGGPGGAGEDGQDGDDQDAGQGVPPVDMGAGILQGREGCHDLVQLAAGARHCRPPATGCRSTTRWTVYKVGGEGASPQGLPDRHKSARWPYDLPAYSWTGASGPSPIRVQETRARSPTARPRPIWEIPADSRCPAGKVNRGRGTPARVGESHRPFGLSVPRVEFLSGR